MGLDMYLKESAYIGHWSHTKPEEYQRAEAVHKTAGFVNTLMENGGLEVETPVAYWRKAHAIHGWFVENVQGGVDECQKVEVTVGQLQELVEECKKALATKDTSELPATDGFFYGMNREDPYDEWYWLTLQETVDMLTPIIETSVKAQEESDNPQWAACYFTYQSSW